MTPLPLLCPPVQRQPFSRHPLSPNSLARPGQQGLLLLLLMLFLLCLSVCLLRAGLAISSSSSSPLLLLFLCLFLFALPVLLGCGLTD